MSRSTISLRRKTREESLFLLLDTDAGIIVTEVYDAIAFSG